MSLINDALKRASQAEANRRSDPGQPPAMQPAPERRRSFVPVLLGVWIFLLSLIAGWFLWCSWPNHENPAPRPVAPSAQILSTQSANATLPPPPAADPSNAVGTPRRDVQPPAIDPAKVEVSTNVNGGAAAPPYQAAPAPPPFPELKVQSIFFSRNNPRASINGQIRAENDLVGEVRILTITSNKVTVEWNGRTKDLILEGP